MFIPCLFKTHRWKADIRPASRLRRWLWSALQASRSISSPSFKVAHLLKVYRGPSPSSPSCKCFFKLSHKKMSWVRKYSLANCSSNNRVTKEVLHLFSLGSWKLATCIPAIVSCQQRSVIDSIMDGQTSSSLMMPALNHPLSATLCSPLKLEKSLVQNGHTHNACTHLYSHVGAHAHPHTHTRERMAACIHACAWPATTKPPSIPLAFLDEKKKHILKSNGFLSSITSCLCWTPKLCYIFNRRFNDSC